MSTALDEAGRFAVDVWRTLTWRVMLYTLLAGLVMEMSATIGRIGRPDVPQTMVLAGLVISLTSAFCIMLAVLIANQAIERGTRPWPTYLFALLAGTVLAVWLQDEIREVFGLYTRIDRPGVPAAVRDTVMVYFGLGALINGFIYSCCCTSITDA